MDAILIEQVLINLLENAILHSKSSQPISCHVEVEVESIVFHVRDYGIGIPPERIRTIFDGTPYTGNPSPDSSKGMGIGLSICKPLSPPIKVQFVPILALRARTLLSPCHKQRNQEAPIHEHKNIHCSN